MIHENEKSAIIEVARQTLTKLLLGPFGECLNNYSNELQMLSLSNRIIALETLFTNISHVGIDDELFAQRKIIIKYIEDFELLEETFQVNIGKFLSDNFLHDDQAKEAVYWLNTTPTFKLNRLLKCSFFIAVQRERYFLSLKHEYISDITELGLGDYDVSYGLGGGPLKSIKINRLGIFVFTNVLGVCDDSLIEQIDILNDLTSQIARIKKLIYSNSEFSDDKKESLARNFPKNDDYRVVKYSDDSIILEESIVNYQDDLLD